MGHPHKDGNYLSSYIKVPWWKLSGSSGGSSTFRSHSWYKIPFAIYSFLLTVAFLVAICFLPLKKMKCACRRRKHLKSLISGPLTNFSYSELSLATAKFTERIGGGGFGTVYKGVLKDGTMVAVKRLETTGQGIDEFVAEVDTIGNIHHV